MVRAVLIDSDDGVCMGGESCSDSDDGVYGWCGDLR